MRVDIGIFGKSSTGKSTIIKLLLNSSKNNILNYTDDNIKEINFCLNEETLINYSNQFNILIFSYDNFNSFVYITELVAKFKAANKNFIVIGNKNDLKNDNFQISDIDLNNYINDNNIFFIDLSVNNILQVNLLKKTVKLKLKYFYVFGKNNFSTKESSFFKSNIEVKEDVNFDSYLSSLEDDYKSLINNDIFDNLSISKIETKEGSNNKKFKVIDKCDYKNVESRYLDYCKKQNLIPMKKDIKNVKSKYSYLQKYNKKVESKSNNKLFIVEEIKNNPQKTYQKNNFIKKNVSQINLFSKKNTVPNITPNDNKNKLKKIKAINNHYSNICKNNNILPIKINSKTIDIYFEKNSDPYLIAKEAIISNKLSFVYYNNLVSQIKNYLNNIN